MLPIQTGGEVVMNEKSTLEDGFPGTIRNCSGLKFLMA